MQARSQLAALDMAACSQRAVAALGDWEPLWRASAVAAYWPMADELDLLPLLRRLLQTGVALYLPHWDGGGMELVRVLDLDSLPKKRVGTSLVGHPVQGEVYEGRGPLLALVPALGLDWRGWRLGRGGGFYDRYLARGYSLTTVGVVPQALIFPEIPHETHDAPLHFVGGETTPVAATGNDA